MSVRRGGGVLGLFLLVGCATPYADGRVALQAGRYADAARHFEDALARDPNRLDALLGLGIARYREGKLAEAVVDLARVVSRQPSSETAHLYLALAYLRGGRIPDAEATLTRLLALAPRPRVAREATRALALIRQEPAPTEEARNVLAARLEAEADAARDAPDDRFVRGGALLGTCCNMFGFDAVPAAPPRAR